MDSGRSRCWENIWSCCYLTILRHAIQLFMGCFGSRQLPRPPGYEDPVLLSTETSCKSVFSSIKVSNLYSRCPCLQQHLNSSELIACGMSFFCCLSLFLYVKSKKSAFGSCDCNTKLDTLMKNWNALTELEPKWDLVQ